MRDNFFGHCLLGNPRSVFLGDGERVLLLIAYTLLDTCIASMPVNGILAH